jgi:hypothetical protein
MNEVLLVYKEVNLINEKKMDVSDIDVLTVSIDEKPGVQAIMDNPTQTLPPIPMKGCQ